jgi:hypothetical protein
VVITSPSPLDRVAGLNVSGAGIEPRATLADLHCYGRGGSQNGKKQGKKSERPEFHSGELFNGILGGANSREGPGVGVD